jgi:hypothetical protein
MRGGRPPGRRMSIEQVCLIVALNLLAGTFLAWRMPSRRSDLASAVLLALIILGFGLMWRSLL